MTEVEQSLLRARAERDLLRIGVARLARRLAGVEVFPSPRSGTWFRGPRPASANCSPPLDTTWTVSRSTC